MESGSRDKTAPHSLSAGDLAHKQCAEVYEEFQ
jgi:hypothetical protein